MRFSAGDSGSSLDKAWPRARCLARFGAPYVHNEPVGSVKAGVMIFRVAECPTATVAVICFQIPSNFYSDRHN
jgi:hypothetical protein